MHMQSYLHLHTDGARVPATVTTTLTCRFGHRFESRATPGGTTGCPACRRETGTRTSVRVPVGAHRATGQQDEGQGDEGLAARWARETPAVYAWQQMPMQPADVACEDCGGATFWHSAHGALVCLECGTAIDSPGVAERAEAHAESLVRRAARASGTPIAAEVDPGAEARNRAARVELHRAREFLQRYADEMCEMSDGDDYERSQFARLAYDIGGTIRGYLPEIRDAGDKDTLAAIWGELKEIREGDGYRSLVQEASEQNERVERRARAADIAADRERQELAEARAIAAEQQRQARIAAQQPRRELTAAPTPRPVTPPSIAPAIASMAQLAEMLAQSKREKQAQIAANGACGFCRGQTPATRVYGTATQYQQPGGYGWSDTIVTVLNENAPNIRACDKHHAKADNWMQQHGGGDKHYYWELGKLWATCRIYRGPR
jgi:hypothetical protein